MAVPTVGDETTASCTAKEGISADAAAARWLFPQPQLADDAEIAIPILAFQVRQQPRPFAYQHEQAASAGKIFLMHPQVLRQLVDPAGEQGNLHFR